MIPLTTMTGRVLNLQEPMSEDIRLEDVACGLARTCRFAGQIVRFYSVAQHAVLVSKLVDEAHQLAALHHDDTEAYMCDLPRFLKHSGDMEGYRLLEQTLDQVIQRALLPEAARRVYLSSELVEYKIQLKAADNLAAIFEHAVLRLHRQFRPSDIDEACASGYVDTPAAEMQALVERLPVGWTMEPLGVWQAHAGFLARHFHLMKRFSA